jgi:hypothetical protein
MIETRMTRIERKITDQCCWRSIYPRVPILRIYLFQRAKHFWNKNNIRYGPFNPRHPRIYHSLKRLTPKQHLLSPCTYLSSYDKPVRRFRPCSF